MSPGTSSAAAKPDLPTSSAMKVMASVLTTP